MAVSVKELQNELGERFQLRLLAGQKGLNAIVTWVHMMEDTNVVDFFWGNEMVVTSGYQIRSEEDLLNLLKVLEAKRCAGLVINTGKYINQIPDSVIERCNEKWIPLFSMPWQMSMVEFVRTSCTSLTKSARSEEDLAQAVMNAVNTPQNPGGYRDTLSSFFTEEKGLRMIAVRIEAEHLQGAEEKILDQRSFLRLHTAMRDVNVPYLIFRNGNKRVFVLINSTDARLAADAGARILERIKQRLHGIPIQVGIGDLIHRFEDMPDAYHSAVSARRCASLQGLELVKFSEMGFYRLLYSVPNDELLDSFYEDTVGVLSDYDKDHNTQLLETLFRYLLADGSLSEVAAQMYTHRNTVNYRMSKVREITGCSLDTAASRMPYMLAYYIGTILNIPFNGKDSTI